MTVVVPTLAAGTPLAECLASLDAQRFRDFDIIIVDNSGVKRARQTVGAGCHHHREPDNVGFGAAINEAVRASLAPFIATLNDDATADPGWLESMLLALEGRPDVGMVAPQIRLRDTATLDSAGLLICGDGSSKQRGHGEPPEKYNRRQETLLPSGCAALYRREMLDEVGGFDAGFFLYCEDTDLGLRARWEGWECLYVPAAVAHHGYSQTAGRASPMKAFYVERNRLFLLVKDFPTAMLLAGAAVLSGPLFLARGISHARARRGGRVYAVGPARVEAAGLRVPRLARAVRRNGPSVAGAPAHPRNGPPDAEAVQAAAAALLHQPEAGGGAVIRRDSGDVLILIPALNEEAAVASVIHEVQAVMPGVDIIVADDSSTDNTRAVSRAAGAEVLTLPAHLGLGGCVQAGYKLAFELGYNYVIRVDGDGQHDPGDIPRILEALRKTGCQMVIGSRFVARNGQHTTAPRAIGIHFSACCSGRFWARRCTIPPPDSWASIARRWPYSAAAFRSNTRRLRRWWCCSAGAFSSWRCPVTCASGAAADVPSRRFARSTTWFTFCWACS